MHLDKKTKITILKGINLLQKLENNVLMQYFLLSILRIFEVNLLPFLLKIDSIKM